MLCSSPLSVAFTDDGKITFSKTDYNRELASFKLPCSKCLECRIKYSQDWALRCSHEAQMHENNSFITLTYSDEKLQSPRLDYSHFQNFMKRLRNLQNDPIGYFVTGEYGERTKRPHWHAILFNYRPRDLQYHRQNDNGDKIYRSEGLDHLWGWNDPKVKPNELGDVSLSSAAYVARYAAKKLIHGHDQDHDYHPISKKSSKYAIGKKWLEKYWNTDCFNQGYIIRDDKTKTRAPIPRYYEKWLKTNHPAEYARYVTQTKAQRSEFAQEKNHLEEIQYNQILDARNALGKWNLRPPTRNEVLREIRKVNFKRLHENKPQL